MGETFSYMTGSKQSDPTDRKNADRGVHEPKSRNLPEVSGVKALRKTHQMGNETNVPTSDSQQGLERLEQHDQPPQDNGEVDLLVEAMIAEHEGDLQTYKTAYRKIEAELSLSQKDNARLREQRHSLRQQRSDFKQQCADLQNQRADFEKKINDLKRHSDKLDDECDWINSRYQHLLKRVIQPYAESKGFQWDDQSGATIDVVVDPLSYDALEVTSLRQQVQALQKELLAKVEKTQAMSDDQLGQNFRNLVALIKTLSRTIRPTREVNILEILGSPVLLIDVAQEHWTGRAKNKYFIEAWIWSVLLDKVFASPFTVFGNVSHETRDFWQRMFRTTSHDDWPRPSSVSEVWRYATMERLLEFVEPSAIIDGRQQGEANIVKDSVMQARSDLLNILGGYLTEVAPATDITQVYQVINKAFALALQMSLQRARLQLTYPGVGATFNEEEMSAMPDEDTEDVIEGVVTYVVNPGLTKWGDAHGKYFDHRYDIVPALVQIEPTAKDYATVEMHEVGDVSKTRGGDRCDENRREDMNSLVTEGKTG